MVWIQVPPSLSSRIPATPVSAHVSRPKGVNAAPGSKYKSFPFSLTRTTLALSFLFLHGRGGEEVIAAVRDPASVRIEARRPNQSQIEPSQLHAVAITPLPDFFDISSGFSFSRFCSCSVFCISYEVLRICCTRS